MTLKISWHMEGGYKSHDKTGMFSAGCAFMQLSIDDMTYWNLQQTETASESTSLPLLLVSGCFSSSTLYAISLF